MAVVLSTHNVGFVHPFSVIYFLSAICYACNLMSNFYLGHVFHSIIQALLFGLWVSELLYPTQARFVGETDN